MARAMPQGGCFAFRERFTVSVSTAYFDVDGTLVGTNLLHPTVMYFANQASPALTAARVGRALLQAPQMAIAEMWDRRLFNEMLFSHYKGMSEDRIAVLSEEVFESVVKPRIFKGAQSLIDKCHQADQRVVLVTGSLDWTIEILTEYLGADDFIANRLEMNHG